MRIFRIENPVSNNGMWYNSAGDFDPFIYKLTEGISKDLPMDFDPRYKEGGVSWYSAGTSKEQMNQWFSVLDAIELMQSGYKLFQFDVTNFKKEEHQVLFTRDGITHSEEIPLNLIWEMR